MAVIGDREACHVRRCAKINCPPRFLGANVVSTCNCTQVVVDSVRRHLGLEGTALNCLFQ